MKTFLTVAGIALLIVGGVYLWVFPETLSGLFGGKPEPEEPVVPVDTRATYASSTLGLSLRYPQNYILDESYKYNFSSAKSVSGVKFSIPPATATGTNLSSDSYISIERLPRALNCTGDIYLKANVRAQAITEGGVSYSLATSSEGAAGNSYEEWVYAFPNSKPCTAVRYFIHSTNIANYPGGAVREFDKASLIADFDQIRRSLQFNTVSPASTSTQP